jgi:hypothetical protein
MGAVDNMPEIVAKGARQKPPQRLSPVAGPAPASNVDRLLAASGVAIACSTLAFAGYMVADSDRPPRIAGMEYLSIFARPSHPPVATAQREAPIAAEASNQPAAALIDPTPTGSILDRAASGRPVNLILTPIRDVDSKTPSSPYRILDVSKGEALIANQTGSRRVRAGDIVPDLGRINAIEKRGDHWVLLIQDGAPLAWPAPTPAAIGAPAPKKKTSSQ